MPRTKRQHYVPQLHLRHFLGEDPPDMLWTYDVFEGTWRQSTPENTGFESNFYAVQDQHGKYNDALEDWLSRSESKAALIYRNLIDGEIPIDQERADFSTFIASLYARSPAMLRTYGEVLGMSSQATMQFVASDPERFEASLKQFERDKGPIDPTVRAGLRDFILDPTRYTMEVDRRATLPALALSDKLQDLFFKMGWIVVDTPAPIR